MSAYGRDEYEDLDEYEDFDEYEEDGDEAGEEEYEEEEEVHQPTAEEIEYLGLREQLKERFRKKLKKESGSARSSSLIKRNLPAKDNFGSFFGPSRPVIAQRVIQESKSLLEIPDVATRVFKSSNVKSKSSASTPVVSKPRPSGSAPKVANGVKSKVQILKNTRDYSFLLTDDAELPSAAKDNTPRNFSAPKSDSRPAAKVQQRMREPLSNGGRKVPDGRDERKVNPSVNPAQAKMATQKLASISRPKQTPVDPKRQIPSNKGSGPGRPSGEKAAPSRNPSGLPLQKKVPVPGARVPVPGARVPVPGAKVSVPGAKVPVPAPKKLPSAKQPPPRSQPVSKPALVQKRVLQESSKPKVMQKQPVSSSKSQVVKQPPARIPARVDDERMKRKPVRRDEPRRRFDDDDDDDDAINMIRQMFRYNPNKYRDEDDDSDMEANFDEIQLEERRSHLIAKKEDEIALREIEEEERRERMRKEAKKRKLSQR